MKLTLLILIVGTVFLVACNADQEKQSFAENVESAHKKDAFLAETAVQFDLFLRFNEKTRLDGTLTLLTNSTKGKIEEKNGSVLYYDNETVYVAPDSSLNASSIRFKAYTWSYFFLLPYKLTDDGTKWEDYPKKAIADEVFNAEKLTFESGTGDAPDDWYILYQDQKSELLKYAAYIVTANKTVAEAEEDPHAIAYSNYEDIDGVPIATEWTFHGWDLAKNRPTELLGTAFISNIKFVDTADAFFNPPPNFVEQ